LQKTIEAEAVSRKNNILVEFQAHETVHQKRPHQPGLLATYSKKLAFMQARTKAAKR